MLLLRRVVLVSDVVPVPEPVSDFFLSLPEPSKVPSLMCHRHAVGFLVNAGFMYDRAIDLLSTLTPAKTDYTPWYWISDVHALDCRFQSA